MTNSPPLCAVGPDCRGQDQPPREVWDNGFLCGPCRGRLERWIGELPALHTELADALLPSGGLGTGRPSYRNAWPVNPAALGLAQEIYGKLGRWATDIADRRGITPPTADITAIAAWLTTHTDWIGHWEWGHEMYREIRELNRAIYSAVYPNRDRKRFPLPRHRRQCPDCGGDMYAIVAGETHAGTMVQCSSCGREWAPTEWFRLGRRILATPQQRQSA